MWLELVVSADRKLDLTSSLLKSACHGRCGSCRTSSKLGKGKDAPSCPMLLTLGLLLPVGFDTSSPPPVKDRDGCGCKGELLDFGAVNEAPLPLGRDAKAEGFRRPVFTPDVIIG
jgi:hypothetical protein